MTSSPPSDFTPGLGSADSGQPPSYPPPPADVDFPAEILAPRPAPPAPTKQPPNRRLLVAIAVVTLLVLGGGAVAATKFLGGEQGPADVVRDFFTAIEDGDADEMCRLVDLEGGDEKECRAGMKMFTVLFDQVDFDMDSIDFTVSEETSDSAVVRVKGEGEAERTDVRVIKIDGSWKIAADGLQ